MLGRLGSTRALVVHGLDGLDEITLGKATQVWEMKSVSVSSYTVSPEELGFGRASRDALKAGSVDESTRMLRAVLEGKPGPARDVVLMNAGAALLAADKVATLKEGVAMAEESIDSGRARQKLDALVELSQRLE